MYTQNRTIKSLICLYLMYMYVYVYNMCYIFVVEPLDDLTATSISFVGAGSPDSLGGVW